MHRRLLIPALALSAALTLGYALPVAAQSPSDTSGLTSNPNPSSNPTPITSNPNTGLTSNPNSPSGGSGIDLSALTSYKNGILGFINGIAAPILIAVAFIVFLYGVAKAYIIEGASEDARKEGHQIILWGIIGFVVIFSVWGIVNIVMGAFGFPAGGSAGSYNLAPPTL